MIPTRNIVVVVATILSILVPYALASAAKQFGLSVDDNASNCWVTCQNGVTHTVNVPGIQYNGDSYIAQNCKVEDYLTLMPLCFVQYCVSAPDVAYAKEFGEAMCKKAGVDVELKLPDSYLEAAKEYFESEAYLTGKGVRGVRVWGTPGILFILSSVIFLSFAS